MTIEKKELLDSTFQTFMDVGFSQENLSLLEEIVAKDVVGFGTAIDEKLFGVKELQNLLVRQKEQSAGMQTHWKINTLDVHLSSDENTAIYTNDLQLYLTVDGNTIEMYMRFSVVLEYVQQKWLVVHWHGSKPEHVESEKDTWGLETWKAKAEELEKQVAERTTELVEKNRELEVESALERVRAMTMAMHSSDDVGKCIIKMFSELTALGVDEGTRFGIGILNHDNENNQLWTARKDGEEVNMHIGNLDMTSHPLLKSARKAWKEQQPLHRYVLEGEDLLGYYQMLNNAPDYKILVPIEKLPEKEFHYGFVFEHGFFYAFSRSEFQPELILIAQRFSSLFEQTYRRYLDLVKAEAQAREAEIELALERVRARTMAMHHTEELKDVIQVVFDQFVGLNINVEHAGFILDYKEREDMQIWLADEHAIPFRVTLPYFDCAHWNSFRDAKEHGKNFFTNLLDFEEKNQFYKDLFAFVPGVPEASLAYYLQCPGLAISTVLLDNVGLYIENFSGIPYTDEENKILMRFGKVFQQTYTRFLDLQKAEAQAREAQIEAALEKVRSRSLAMHRAVELGEVVTVVVEKLRELHIPVDDGVALVTYVEGSKDLIEWMENPGFPAAIKFYQPYFDHPVLSDFWKAKNEGLDFIAPRYNAEENRSFLEHIFEYGDYKNTLQEVKDYCLAANTYSYSVAFQKNSSIFINDYSGRSLSDAEIEILKRFSKIFEQAYIRFLDLQKAEAQAKESKIEAALERVRSRTMAMQSSAELGAVAAELFAQMNQLVTNLWTCGFVLCEKDRDEDEWWLSMDGDFTRGFFLPNVGDYAHATLYEGWLKGEPLRAVQLDGEALQQHYDWLMEIPVSRAIFEEMDAAGLARPDWQKLHAAYFSKGYLVLITREPCREEEIFKRFAQVFDQTYIRFLDLQKAEAQAKEAQIELSLERIRSQVTAMQESSDLLDIVVTMRTEFVKLGHEAHYFWHMRWLPERYDKAMTSGDGTKIGMVMTLPRHIHGDIPLVADWEKTKEPTVVLAMDVEAAVDYVEKMITLGDFEQVDPQAPTLDDIRHIGGLTFVMARTTHGEIGYSLPGVVTNPPKDAVDTLVRFAGVFELAYKRFEDLKYTEQQHREAQIELALERVRARTMAMQHSDELADASQVLDQQVRALGIETWGCAFHVYADNAEGDHEWFSSANGNLPFYKTPREKFFLTFYEKGQQGEKFHVEEFKDDDCKAHYDFLKTIPVMGDALRALEASGIPLPTYQIDHIAFFQHGYILFITYKPVPEAHDIFQRFAKVFEQTYTRFLDLQKSESQAKEAKIEAALERVRAASMAMHKSEELQDVIKVVAHQITELGIHFNTANFTRINENMSWEMWITTPEQPYPSQIHVPFFENKLMRRMTLINKKNADAWTDVFNKEEKDQFFYHFFENTIARHIPDERKIFVFSTPGMAISTFVTKNIMLSVAIYECTPFTEEENKIFNRFAKVFEQTYTRFLDLKKAEAQAREAQIEVALERTRTQSMLMQHSGELNEISKTFHEQLLLLGIDSEFSFVWLPDEEKKEHMFWATWVSEEVGCTQYHSRAINYPLDKTEPGTAACYVAWESSEPVHETFVPPGDIVSFFAAWEELLRGAEKIRPEFFPDGIYYTEAYMKYGCFGIDIRRRLNADEKEIIRRFAVEFERTYTRFLDLKKAEAQAMEAIKRASVDRVRAEIASMRTTTDLERIQPLIWSELTTLGVPFIRCGVFILVEEKREVQAFLSNPDGKSIAAFHLPYDATEQTKQIVSHWQQRQLFKDHMDEKAFAEYTQNLVQQGALASDEKYITENRPTDLYLHFLPFLQGMIYAGNDAPLNEDELQLVQNLADAFSTAYARYEDFNKLEAAKAAVESAMRELKATQSQLVQQEKLASLGQLTAGIAHEIKNPLNFVNNFTEVSIELIEEALEENVKHEDVKDTSLINQNLEDIKSNLKKVYDHGTRANSIVNAMLMHSRAGTGKPEPTMVNDFIREYSNLAFHGMRASNSGLDVQMKFDMDEKVKDVPLIAEDFSRVVLNICNNAFDACAERSRSAMREKSKYEVRSTKYEVENTKDEVENTRYEVENATYEVQGTKYEGGEELRVNYVPTLSIQTKLENGKVLIRFEDNGPGITDEIRDKIMQPFFTTKKGTEGTGLGLSISHDIVKAHGGVLKLETQVGEGTTFIIEIPKMN